MSEKKNDWPDTQQGEKELLIEDYLKAHPTLYSEKNQNRKEAEEMYKKYCEITRETRINNYLTRLLKPLIDAEKAQREEFEKERQKREIEAVVQKGKAIVAKAEKNALPPKKEIV